MTPRSSHRLVATALATGLFAVACGDDDSGAPDTDAAPAATEPTGTEPPATEPPGSEPATTEPPGSEPPVTELADSITLVTYDSFPVADTSLNDALDAFSDDTGIDVEILVAGDTGTMLSKAELTAGNPEGDVMWGIDNSFLSRAVDAGVFEPYESAFADDLRPDLRALVPGGEATPVDFGDVCVNYDIGALEDLGIAPPATLEDLADPAYADLLVVQNPATSSPGLAFLLATVDEYGEDGWQDYWTRLRENGVAVTDGWNDAYYGQFTWAGGGDRPLVVSYGSSPPAEVIFAVPPRDDSPTGVVDSTCFRQVEFAGVLAGTDHPAEARMLVDFLATDEFQRELALNLFVYPANTTTELPQEFVDFAVVPDEPRSLDPAAIAANRSAWIDEWTTIVLG